MFFWLLVLWLASVAVTAFSPDSLDAEWKSVASPGLAVSSSNEDAFLISFRSTNLPVVTDDVYICYAHDMTSLTNSSSYIVNVEPKPIPGHSYHMYISLCDEPWHRTKDGGLEPWECGVLVPGQPNPPLTRGQECRHSYPIPIGEFAYHYQAGPTDQSIASFPPGTGMPIGGPEDPKFLVTSFHFFSRNETLDGMTGVSGLDVTLVNETTTPLTPWYYLNFETYGYLDPRSVGLISGSWSLRNNDAIRLHMLYVHWHVMAIDVRVEIERKDASRDLILHQDPLTFWGVTSLPEAVVMSPGDRLIVSCSYNNTMDEVVRVKDLTMCVAIVTYSVEGNGPQLETGYVFSFEEKYRECFPRIPAPGYEVNFDAHDTFSGLVPEDMCLNHTDHFHV